MRIGEAANPGPVGADELGRWCLTNVTGFANLAAALAWGAQLTGVVELRGTPEEARREAKAAGVSVALSKPDDEGRCLVGIFLDSNKGHQVAVPCEGWETRVVAVQVLLDKRVTATVVCLYGHVSPTALQRNSLDDLVHGLLEHNAAAGRGPMLIMGDFNLEESQMRSLDLARRAGWRDLGTEGTCCTAASKGVRRIDMVWASPNLAGRAGRATVTWEYGLPVHAVQYWDVAMSRPDRLPHWQLGDTGPGDGEEGFTDWDWSGVFSRRQGDWEDSLVRQDVDQAWQVLEEALVECHGLRSPGYLKPEARIIVKLEEAPQDSYSGEATVLETRAAQHRKRILQQLHGCHGRGECARQVEQLRAALCRDPDPAWAIWGALSPTKEDLSHLVEVAKEAEDTAVRLAREKRRNSWREWCSGQSSGSMRSLYRYVKNGPAAAIQLGLWRNSEGEIFAGKHALLRASEEAWWPLWQPVFPEPRVRADFEFYPALPIQALTGRQLEAVAWGAAQGKAPGKDGWTLRRMRQWPTAVWNEVAKLLAVIETVGHWPEALRSGTICLLPKGGLQAGAAAPLEARPVVLLAQLYRLWAAARAGDLGKWMRHHRLRTETGRLVAAEELALLAAGVLEEAEATGQEAAILALDQSKAYDRVPHDLVEELVDRSGLHPAIGRPMLNMICGPKRVKVLDIAGQERQPTSGLVPGCPMATFVMELLLHRWRSRVRGYGQARVPKILRTWVDDSTAGDLGKEQSVKICIRGLRAIMEQMDTDRLQVNCSKSAIVAAPESHRDALQELMEGWRQWPHGGLMVLSDEVIPADLVALIIERLGAQDSEVQIGTQENLFWAKAGKASVLVHLPGPEIPPFTCEVVREAGGVILRGWPDTWDEASRGAAAGALQESRRRRKLVVPVLAAVKDLGVVIGSGAAGRQQHQKRLHELFRRTALIGGLGISFPKRERLVAGSGNPAALYGCAAQPPDADTLDVARRHVMAALHRGSHFCQSALFFQVAVSTWRADPALYWVVRAVEAVKMLGRELGQASVQRLINCRTKGPVGGCKVALKWAGLRFEGMQLVAGGGERCGFLEAPRHELRTFVQAAVRARDLAKAGARKGQQELHTADIEECKRILRKLPGQGLLEAARAVATGDVVTRSSSKHWQQHDGLCPCGGGPETVLHFLWQCPFGWRARQVAGGPPDGFAELPGSQRKLGIPCVPAALQAWRAQWRAWTLDEGHWTAPVFYTDASSFFPRDAQLRVVGWAAVAHMPDDTWNLLCGVLPPGSTVAQGEAHAVAAVLRRLQHGGQVVTDCWAVAQVWQKARAHKEDDGAPLWKFQEAFREAQVNQQAQIRWIPSHKSFGEALRYGLSPEDWAGNGLADAVAKWAARQSSPPAHLVEQRASERGRNEQLLRVAGQVLLERLKLRPRLQTGAALKVRKRQQPALPRRLREPKRRRQEAPKVSEVECVIEDLVHQAKRAVCSREVAHDMAWFCPPPVNGIHHLQPLGPWPAAGTVEAKNGRLPGCWVCSKCGAKASDSSRVLEVLRKPCGQVVASMERAKHEWSDSAEPRCGRCGLICTNGRLCTAREQFCPVPRCTLAGQPWPEGEASMRREIGRLQGFRKWCEFVQDPGEPVGVWPVPGGQLGQPPGQECPLPPQAEPLRQEPSMALLAPVRFHLSTKLGRYWFCLHCFEKPGASLVTFQKARCAGVRPAHEVPLALKRLAVLWGPWATFGSGASARLGELIGAGVLKAAEAEVSAGVAGELPAGHKRKLSEANPSAGVAGGGSQPVEALLAAASGAERRAIKLASAPSASHGSVASSASASGPGSGSRPAGWASTAIGRALHGAAQGAAGSLPGRVGCVMQPLAACSVSPRGGF